MYLVGWILNFEKLGLLGWVSYLFKLITITYVIIFFKSTRKYFMFRLKSLTIMFKWYVECQLKTRVPSLKRRAGEVRALN